MTTKAEKQWMSDAAALGCVVCRNIGYGETPAEIHHIKTGCGISQRSSHFNSIPLCHKHHRTGGYGVAFHAGSKVWQELHGLESSLLEQTKNDVIGFRASLYGRAG